MADFKTCFNFMMDSEDPRREYADVEDVGGRAISGINSKAFPGEYACIAATAQKYRAKIVEEFYKSHFWNKWLDQITSDALACRVFDAEVNMGARTAVRLLQETINFFLIDKVKEDGILGKDTVDAVNDYPRTDMHIVAEFQLRRSSHYQAIAAENPDKAKYLAGWIVRAER